MLSITTASDENTRPLDSIGDLVPSTCPNLSRGMYSPTLCSTCVPSVGRSWAIRNMSISCGDGCGQCTEIFARRSGYADQSRFRSSRSMRSSLVLLIGHCRCLIFLDLALALGQSSNTWSVSWSCKLRSDICLNCVLSHSKLILRVLHDPGQTLQQLFVSFTLARVLQMSGGYQLSRPDKESARGVQ